MSTKRSVVRFRKPQPAYTVAMNHSVRAIASCRADLAGGTLDIWPLGVLHPGALTCNIAVPVMVELEVLDGGHPGVVNHQVGNSPPQALDISAAMSDLTAAIAFHLRPEGGLAVRVLRQAPLCSGLGGSSAYGVALVRAIAALDGHALEDKAVVHLVRDFEARVLQVATGTQDHWAAVLGGAIALHLEPGGERVERLDVDPAWLADRLTLFFTGMTHHSGFVNWQVIRRRMDRDPYTTDRLQAIAEAAIQCRSALCIGDGAGVRNALTAEWTARKELAPEVCPPELRAIERAAISGGAGAFKACGAGGGGSILVWHSPGKADDVGRALLAAAPDGRLFPRGMACQGCEIFLDSVR